MPFGRLEEHGEFDPISLRHAEYVIQLLESQKEMRSALPKESCGLFLATQQCSVGAGMELWIARQRRDREKTCGLFNSAIYGTGAIDRMAALGRAGAGPVGRSA